MCEIFKNKYYGLDLVKCEENKYIPALTKYNADLIKNAIYISEKFSFAVDETNKKSPAFHFSKIKKIGTM